MKDVFDISECKLTMEGLKKRITASSGSVRAETVIKNGKIVDVFNGEVMEGDVAITDGIFVGIGKFDGDRVIDAEGRYICPTFIDGHVHIESSMVTAAEFAKVLLPHGVTAVVADPHEIANVAGARGIEYMLEASEGLALEVFIMLPSCVPATPFETSGARLEAEDLKPFLNHPRVLGLGEVMNYPAVIGSEETMLNKLLSVMQSDGKIDGHAAGLGADGINVYMTAGIRTDHEAVSEKEARDRIARGMYLMIREGTAAKDLDGLIGSVTPHNSRRCIFVTDDKHLDELVKEGSVDHNVRLAIRKGIPPVTAIQMASLNTAECFGLKGRGAVAPGYRADFMLLDNLEEVKINEVYKYGRLVAKRGKPEKTGFENPGSRWEEELTKSMKLVDVSKEDLKIYLGGQKANVIEIVPNSLITRHRVSEVGTCDGEFLTNRDKDDLKLIVVQRHNGDKYIGRGIVRGFNLNSGAIASTIAHDSHNLILLGYDDEDMFLALKEIERMGGGITVVKDGEILASLSLKIGGLMSSSSWEEVLKNLGNLNTAIKLLGASGEFNPFLTLSFLALPVIPELKITDRGLFDVRSFRHIGLEAD